MKFTKEFKTTSFISEAIEVKGTLHVKGGIRIDGKLDGEIRCESTIYVGETARINALISTRSIVSSGQINGNITATDTTKLTKPGRVKGDINTASLGIEKEVYFEGRCRLLPPEDNPRPRMRSPKAPKKAISERD